MIHKFLDRLVLKRLESKVMGSSGKKGHRRVGDIVPFYLYFVYEALTFNPKEKYKYSFFILPQNFTRPVS